MRAIGFGPCTMVLCLAPFLAGFCENVTTDPHDGGYLGGICGMSTGRYQERIHVKEDQVDELEGINGSLQRDLEKNQHEAGDLDRAVAASSRRLKADRAAVETLSAEIERLKQKKAASEQELTSLQGNVEEMRRELAEIRQAAANKEKVERDVREGVQMAASQHLLETLIGKTRIGLEKIKNKTVDVR